MSKQSVAALRALIEERFPDASPLTHRTAEHVATGIGPLDEILPSGGLPRGHLTVWAPQGGAIAMLRAACDAAIADGERAAWIDGTGTIAGAFWEPEGENSDRRCEAPKGGAITKHTPLLVIPTSHVHALRATDELLRCGGFALIVLTGLEFRGTENVRLTRSAREGGTALITLTTATSLASLRVTSRLLRYRWRRSPFGDPADVQDVTVRVQTRAVGWNRHTEFLLQVRPHELRLSLESELADRRGLPR